MDREKLMREGKERANRAQEEIARKMREKVNRLDYRTRAIREREMEKVKELEEKEKVKRAGMREKAMEHFGVFVETKRKEYEAMVSDPRYIFVWISD